MKYNPHNYQSFATEFMKGKHEAAVLLDMGLGKTVITLSALNDLLFDSFDIHKVLVIGPLRVARDVWPAEIKKFDHLKDLKYEVVIGTEKERIEALKRKADIYIINRENVSWLINLMGIKFDFDTVVIDELSSFKNGRSERFKALMKVRPFIKNFYGLTGTPAGNGLMDLWAEFRLIDKGARLGRFITNYRDTYFRPDKRNGVIIYSYAPLPFAEEAIYNKISDITISMKSTDYLDMPELINREYKVYLNDEERSKYDALKNELVLELKDEEITAANAASLTTKLCQLANGAIYDDNGEVQYFHERKLDALEDLIEAANGKPLMVCYWFRHDLERIQERLNELKVNYKILTSSESIKEWNEGKLEVGLVNPASCGHGLNLQSGGSTLIFYSLCWSLELYQQVIARLWRQGQQDKSVVVEHIITDGTVDEQILKALTLKDMTQAALINAVKANIGR